MRGLRSQVPSEFRARFKGGVPPPIEVINADLDGTAQGYLSAVHDGPARWVERWAGLGCQLLFEFE